MEVRHEFLLGSLPVWKINGITYYKTPNTHFFHYTKGMTASQQRLIDNIDTSGRAMLVVMDDLVDEEEENPYAELEPLRLVSIITYSLFYV